MRSVEFAGWPHPVSALGFGCASLGSRISRKAGIAAIERALEAGITWFDVAPSYGDGEAEAILGEALVGAKVAILTKVGLQAASIGGMRKIARGFVRPIVSALPAMRSLIRPMRGDAAARVKLNAETIRTSVARSLERLKVDRVAVLALHDPSEEDVRSHEVLRALDDVKRQGLAARVGIAGAFDNFVLANVALPSIDVAQFAAADGLHRTAPLHARGVFTIVHSAFAGGTSLRESLAANAGGVVLASSLKPEHLRANVAAASDAL
jgi:aryl-alcohol dehydrogenase-like predicted oxidoreductase